MRPLLMSFYIRIGGGGGIRTHEGLAAQKFSKLSELTTIRLLQYQAILPEKVIFNYLAMVNPQTFLIPASFKVLVASFIVEPVVQTSSIIRTLGFREGRKLGETRNIPLTFCDL